MTTPIEPDPFNREQATPTEPTVVPPAAPDAPPVAPVAPPVASTPSGWGDAPRYGQYAQPPTPTPGQPIPPGYQAPPVGPSYAQGTPYGAMPMASPYAMPQANKPGIIPLRPLTLGEFYDGAFSAMRHNPKVMIGLALLTVLITMVIGVLIGLIFAPMLSGVFHDLGNDPALTSWERDFYGQFADFGAAFVTVSLGVALTMMLAQPILNGLLTVSVSRSVIGDKASVREVWERVAPRIKVLILWALLQMGVAVGVIALAVGIIILAFLASPGLGAALILLFTFGGGVIGFWAGIRVMLVPPALALEGAKLGATFTRAWKLTYGSFWRLFGIYILASIIVSFIVGLISTPFFIVSGFALYAGIVPFTIVTMLTSVISSTLTTVFLAGVVALQYIDVRMRREGLDVSLTAAAAERQGAPVASAWS